MRTSSRSLAARLFDEAKSRRAVYLIAAYTGLRRGELAKIVWGDVDLERDTLTIRVGVGKAAREDRIALHADAAAELANLRPAGASARDRVFDTLPRDRTFRADLKRAKIELADDAGRVVDFHALRTTFGTNLARAGVMPQVAMRLMRHSDVKIRLKHYTDLRLHDEAKAVAALPSVPDAPGSTPEKQRATGTDGAGALARSEAGSVVAPVVAHRAPEGAPAFGMVRNRADADGWLRLVGGTSHAAQSGYTSGLRTPVQPGAKVKGRRRRKSLNDNLLGAIGAVG